MLNRLQLSLSSLKIALVVGIVVLSGYALNQSGFSLSGAAFTSFVTAFNNSFGLPLNSTTITGQKFNDLNGNGAKNGGESGLAGWTIYATTLVTEFDVEALNTPVVNTPALDNGVTYLAKVTGTYDANDSITADAQYSVRTPNITWTDAVQNYEGYGTSLLDLQINGASPGWGDYNASHTYWTTFTGDGSSKQFRIYDLSNGDNDSGHLHVVLYKVVASTVTNASGNYTLDVGSATGPFTLFEQMQTGWVQTLPGTPDYSYTVADLSGSTQYDFGNQTTTPTPTPSPSPSPSPSPTVSTSDVTICKQDQNQVPQSGWRMALHGAAPVATVNVPSDGSTVSTASLPAGDYALIASGTYRYGTTEMIADAANSYRMPSLPCPGANDWVNGDAVACMQNYLSVNQNVAGSPPFGSAGWGSYFNPAHIYAQGKTLGSASPLSFKIWDDNYGDNLGSIQVDAYTGKVGDTQANGCVTLTQMPYGSYSLEEINHQGWTPVSGGGTVTINSPTHTFNFVNTSGDPQALLPMSYITVENSPPKKIENRITNGSFEDAPDLTGWNVSGDVSLTPADSYALPQNGSKMIRVGKTTNEGNPARVNVLSQQIPAGVRTLGFYYNMFTYDYKGFDNPGFMVFVNDKMVFQRWASEIDRDDPLSDDHNLDSSGWQYIGLDLSKYPEGTTLTLAFYAGNETLNEPVPFNHQTWVYLDNFSTNEAVVNHLSKFTIHTTPGATAHYRIGSNPTIHTGTEFYLDAQPSNQAIYYWSDNGVMTESTNSFHVLYDDVAPQAISTLTGEYLEDNRFKLNWLSPRDDNQFTAPNSRPTNAAGYEIKYSTSPIAADVDWNSPSLLSPDLVTEDGLPYGGYRSPRPETEQEEYYIRTIGGFDHYYFVVRSFDAATNNSAISNIADVSLAGPTTADNSSDIVINEYLPNPSGDRNAAKPNGEWVELYNKNSADIDVNNWILTDSDSAHTLTISATNSDNNLNTADSGETVVPAHGYLIVYRNGNVPFDMDIAGDTVSLYKGPVSPTNLIDTDTYVNALVDKSFARIPDGTGPIVDPVPTPGRPNASTTVELQPQARIWWQEPNKGKISIFDANNYSSAHYLIEYTYNNGGGEQQGGIQGTLPVTGSRIDKNDIYFASCSTIDCVPHQNVSATSIELTVTLSGAGIPDRTIIQPLTGSWPQ
jgi:hypothetical protein